MAAKLVKAPPSLKAVQHYVNVAIEHEQKDPIIAYYCRLYAVQKGMKIDKQSPEAKQFLFGLMDLLEVAKKNNPGREELTNDLVGQTYVEQHALRLFTFADKQDRAGNFDKTTVKAFYTANLLLDVAASLGEISEDTEKCHKYAKWKTVYITTCQKRGEVPQPGPIQSEEDGIDPTFDFGGMDAPVPSQPQAGSSGAAYPPAQPAFSHPPVSQPDVGGAFLANNMAGVSISAQPTGPASTSLSNADYKKAEQFAKYAVSALQFEDAPTAIDNFQKAIAVLQGKKT